MKYKDTSWIHFINGKNYKSLNTYIHYFVKSDRVYPEGCDCPVNDINKWLKVMKCPKSYPQIKRDFKPFKNIDLLRLEKEVGKRFNQSGARSLCHYVIKDNKVNIVTHPFFACDCICYMDCTDECQLIHPEIVWIWIISKWVVLLFFYIKGT